MPNSVGDGGSLPEVEPAELKRLAQTVAALTDIEAAELKRFAQTVAALTDVEAAELKRLAQTVASGGFDKPIFDKPEAAAFLCIKGRTLDDWMRRKRVPFSKLPSGAVRFRRDQLVEF